MEPRILMVMDRDSYWNLSALARSGAPCTFVPYTGSLTEQGVTDFLNRQKDRFDAVAVFGDDLYSNIRTVVKRHYGGPKVLWHSLPTEAAEDGFVAQIPPFVRVSEFDRIIREAFANL